MTFSLFKKQRPTAEIEAEIIARISADESSVVTSGNPDCSEEATRLRDAYRAALALEGELPPHVFSIPGMSGRKYRRLINRLVKDTPHAAYLEVGSWAGSTACAAIADNSVRAVCIDNWSEFGGPKEDFLRNIESVRSDRTQFTFIESDFRKVDYAALGQPFNIYLFDGPHAYQDQYDGVVIAQPALADRFVLIVDDWNWSDVRDGTRDALAKSGVKPVYAIEIRTTQTNTPPKLGFQLSDWHNGYFLAACEKQRT